MRIVGVLGIGLAGLFVIGVGTAYGFDMRSQSGGTTAAVVNEKGNLHVASDDRTAYQVLGTWPVAKDDGPGSSSCAWSMHRPEPSTRVARTDTFPTPPFS
jgi:hypothetical protein